jgi:hypothetical protein
MADIAPKLISLSAEQLTALHDRIHKSEASPATIEVHHTVLNEMARRKMERPSDEWDAYEILVDSINDVDLTSLGSSLPAEMVEDVIKSAGTNIGNVQTFLTSNGYEMRIEPVEIPLDPFEKMIREEDGKFMVYDSTGKRKFGTYPSKEKAQERLDQIHRFSKADNTPPKAVRDAARRALDWIADGKAGSGFTSVGRRRASQLASGENISLETLKRMKSFFSRHEVDKNALGFSQGEKGYPSAGRVAWDAWGGDAGFAWAESMVARAEKEEVEKHLQGQHDQKSHAPKYAEGIAQEIMDGGHPSVGQKDVGPLFAGFSKLTTHPDITELKVEDTMLFGDEGMGIARKDMPQIPAERRDEFLGDLAKEGVKTTEEEIDPRTLKPIQKEVSGSRSGAIYMRYKEEGAIPEQQRILISKDGFVIDGHHTWGAAVAFAFENDGAKLPVYRIDMTAEDALSRATTWGDAAGIPKQGIDAKEPTKKNLSWEPIIKHGNHDQKTHGAWSSGMVADVDAKAGRSEEAVKLAKEVRDRAVAAEPAITKLVEAVAQQSGAKLEGLATRIKSTDSLARKIDADAEAGYGGDRKKAAEEISDANRYTISVNDTDYADTLKSTVTALEETGWKVRVKNFWQSGDPYDGVNVKASRDGVKVEIQVHTPKSFKTKEKELHDVYEEYRVSTDDGFRRNAWDKMVSIAQRVPRPSNYATVLGVGTLVMQQFETAQQAGLLKSTGVGKLSLERGV